MSGGSQSWEAGTDNAGGGSARIGARRTRGFATDRPGTDIARTLAVLRRQTQAVVSSAAPLEADA